MADRQPPAHTRKFRQSRANLASANLTCADLTRTNLADTNLTSGNLGVIKLAGADLTRANLTAAHLKRADLTGAILRDADLRQSTLTGSRLDGADLTDAKLWETQRGGWSIKRITCWRAFWDSDGEEPVEYGEGEFERFYAEKPKILLRYPPGGMSPVDLAMLPLIVERLQLQYPGSKLNIQSVQDDTGGAAVTITVEDLQDRDAKAFAVEVEALRGDFAIVQGRLRSEQNLRLAFEARYQAVVRDVLPMLLDRALPKQEFNIDVGQLTAPMIIEGTAMSRDTYHISGQAGAVGPGAHAHDNTFQQVQAGGLDLTKLAEELEQLRGAMKSEAATREQDKAVGAVADAEEAAAKGDGPAALRHLKAAGVWGLDIAEKIGVPLAVEALKQAI